MMTEKSALGMGPDKSAKSKAGEAGKDARAKDLPAASAVKSETTDSGSHSSPKKRRKVNHGKLPVRAACDRDRSSDYWLAWRWRGLSLLTGMYMGSLCILSPLSKRSFKSLCPASGAECALGRRTRSRGGNNSLEETTC